VEDQDAFQCAFKKLPAYLNLGSAAWEIYLKRQMARILDCRIKQGPTSEDNTENNEKICKLCMNLALL
jgi:hypothetical protein